MDYYDEKRERQATARRFLPKLLVLHHHRCNYCNIPVVRVSDVQNLCEVLSQDGYTITWQMAGWVFRYPFATADHVVPDTEGGSPILPNLVLACAWCNIKKGRRERPDAGRRPFFMRGVPAVLQRPDWLVQSKGG